MCEPDRVVEGEDIYYVEDRPVSLTEDFIDEYDRAEIDVDEIPDSDTREDDLLAIIDYKSLVGFDD